MMKLKFKKPRQWFTSYYLLTQIIPFVYYSITKRIFRNVEPNTFYVTLIDDLLNWILIEQKYILADVINHHILLVS